MNTNTLQNLLAPITVIRQFYHYPTTDSTMSHARRMIADSPAASQHGVLILADHQSAGKGRHGRSWSAPPGQSVLATLILSQRKLPKTEPGAMKWHGHPARDPNRRGAAPSENILVHGQDARATFAEALQFSLLASAVAVAVCRGIMEFVPAARIKYPNDIVTDGRKLAGILIETCGEYILVGFGINCLQTLDELPPDARMPASSVFLETGRIVPRESVLESVLHQLEKSLQPDAFAASAEEMNALCETLGREICLDLGDRVAVGIAHAITPDGRLMLETPNGIEKISSTQVIRTWSPDHEKEQL